MVHPLRKGYDIWFQSICTLDSLSRESFNMEWYGPEMPKVLDWCERKWFHRIWRGKEKICTWPIMNETKKRMLAKYIYCKNTILTLTIWGQGDFSSYILKAVNLVPLFLSCSQLVSNVNSLTEKTYVANGMHCWRTRN